MLLLVFGIVSVGALVTMGAYGYRAHAGVENRSQVFPEGFQIIADLQQWKQTPAIRDGGRERPGFINVTFETLGYPRTLLSNRVYKTENGCYKLQPVGEEPYVELTLSAPSCAHSDFVARVVIKGAGPGDLDWQPTPSSAFEFLP